MLNTSSQRSLRVRGSEGTYGKRWYSRGNAVAAGADAVPERRLPHPLLREPFEVDLGGDDLGVLVEALRLGQHVAVLGDQGVAVPGEVGGGLAGAGRRVQVRRQAPRRLHRHELAAIAGLADRERGGREVQQDRRAGQRGVRGRRDRHPDVLADLDVDRQQRLLLALEQDAAAERDVGLAEQVDAVAGRRLRRLELARLVVLAIVRQERLRDEAEDLAS
jgi:hypothetical protein